MELVAENRMTETDTSPQAFEHKDVTVKGRFGEITVNTAKALYFPNGILGFEESKGFALADFPTPKMNDHFRLLQSLDAESLSFIMLPLSVDNTIIEKADLLKLAEEVGVSAEKMVVGLIASPMKVGGVMQVTANAKAPIIIDSDSRLACQYVFSHDKYSMKHDVSAIIAGQAAA